MAGRPRTRGRTKALERALQAAGIDPHEIEAHEDEGPEQSMRPKLSVVPLGVAQQHVTQQGVDSTPDDQSAELAPARTIADHRARLMRVADDCLSKLAIRPDRDVSTVYRDVAHLLMKLEAQDKDPEPRPEDVRKGVVDTLQMLPELCAHDAELRALAVDALAKVLEEAESAPSSAPTKD